MILDSDFAENIVIYENCKYISQDLLIDSNNAIVQNFPDYFIIESKKRYDKYCKEEDDFIIFEEPVFFIKYAWSWNYHTNYVETLPNILYYIELLKTNPKLYLACPDNFKDIFFYIFDIYKLDTSLIKVFNTKIIFKYIYISKYSQKNPNLNFKIGRELLIMTNNIRDHLTNKFKEKINNSLTKKIYINRENNLAGANRFIINNSELLDYINKTFQIITFEKMTLEEKFLSTLNSTIVISPIGANLVNFFFSKNDTIKLFILLAPDRNEQFNDANIKQLVELGNIEKNIIKNVTCKTIQNGASPDPINNPYIVNISELNEIIQNYS